MGELIYFADYTDEVALTDQQELERERKNAAIAIRVKAFAVQHDITFNQAVIRCTINCMNGGDPYGR